MSSPTNIINHEEIKEFIDKLKVGAGPVAESYIDKTVKNYIYRKATTKRFFPQLSWRKLSNEKQAIIEKGGPFHEVVLDSSLYNQLKIAVDYISTLTDVSEESVLRISIEDALTHHETLVVQTNNKADTTEGVVKSVVKFKNNYQVVKLEDATAFQREGKLMRHCVGTYSTSKDIYSLRNEENTPLITFELNGSQVVQMRQVCNASVEKKYYPYIKQFVKTMNFTLAPVVYEPGNAFSGMLAPAIITFFSFKWQTLLLWFGLNAGPGGQMMSNPIFSNAVSLALCILAFTKWIEYFSNFSPGGTSKGIQIDLDEVPDDIEQDSLEKPNLKF